MAHAFETQGAKALIVIATDASTALGPFANRCNQAGLG